MEKQTGDRKQSDKLFLGKYNAQKEKRLSKRKINAPTS